MKKTTNNLYISEMKTNSLAQQFAIDYVIKDKWYFPVHKHTHYELQYIIRGKGQHIINGNAFNYDKGDVFVVPPQDNHFFIFQERSTICIVKFNKGYFGNFLNDNDFQNLLANLSAPRRKTIVSSDCRKNISELMRLIMKTHKKTSPYQDILIKNALSLILALVSEDADTMLANPKDEKIQAVLNYINKHIKERDLLSVQAIAASFNINKTYFNQYFKKATGNSYKKYVQEYALNLIAQQLISRDKTLSQLAFEFGYSDESHLSRTFKTHFKQTPSSFRKARRRC